MTKKNNDGENTSKSKKRTVTPGVKSVAKHTQTKSNTSRKPVATPKKAASPHTRKVASDKPQKDWDKNFVVNGQILYADKKPVIDVKVIVFDQDIAREDPLGEAVTDQDGRYQITYSESQFRRTEKEIGGPDLIVRVYSAEGKVMAQSKRKRNADQEETVDLTVGSEESFVVSGTVRRSDGRPAAGAIVRAYDQDLRKKQLLGKKVTDAAGHYSIDYTSRKFLRAEKGRAELYVALVDAKGKKLVSSEVLFNAPSEASINLTLPLDGETLSEFELLLEDILPLLAGQGKGGADMNIAELEDKDMAFLSQETGQLQERIAFLAAAAKTALATPSSSIVNIKNYVSKSQGSAIPVEAFYGWFRKNLPADLNKLWAQPVAMLRTTLKSAITENIIPARFAEQVDSILDQIPHPQRQDLKSLVARVPMSQAAASALLRRADDASSINDVLISKLVAEGSLKKSEANDLGLTLAVRRLADGNMDVIQPLKDASFDGIKGGKLRQVRDLITLEPEDWHSALEAGQVVSPEGMDTAGYARELTGRVARLFPTDFLLQRAGHVPDGLHEQLAQVQPLFAKNPEAFSQPFEGLELEGLPASELPAIREIHARLSRLANLHPGLELHELLAKDLSPTKKAREVERRIGLTQKIYQMNSDLDFLSIDYYPDSEDLKALKLDGLGEDEQRMVFADLRAYQRVYHIAGDAQDARSMIEAGYDSAFAVASANAETLAFETGLPLVEAVRARGAAKERNAVAALHWMAIHNTVNDQHTFINGTFAYAPKDYLMRIPGFAELFGNQNYCSCQHCQSVLSPAAYFVDLMKFVEDNVLSPTFSLPNQNHPLNLKLRRPDLWTLELTCANTNEVVAHLDIINEVLENYIAKQLQPSIVLTNRGGVEDKVYEALSTFDQSFRQPFSLPLERLKIYLSHFEHSIYDIAQAFSNDEGTLARTKLGLSKEEYNLIASSAPKNNAYLTALYAVEVPLPMTKDIGPVEVARILNPTGLTREQLGQVLATGFLQHAGTPKLEIAARMSTSGSVQNDIEEVKGLTGDRLDRLHRFVRLWRDLPWTMMELDYVLNVLKEKSLTLGLDADALKQLSKLLNIQERWKLPVEELCALWADIPNQPVSQTGSLFDRLFNLPPFVKQDGPWPDATKSFTHPAFNSSPEGSSSPDANMLHRLTAGLQVSDEQLAQLVMALAGQLCATPIPASKTFAVNAANLTLLYRHAHLAQLLNLSVPELFQLGQLAGLTYIGGLNALVGLIEFRDWQTSSGFTMDETAFLVGETVLKVISVPDAGKLAKQLVLDIQQDKALQFQDTVFARIEGISEDQSRLLITANTSPQTSSPALELVPGGGMWRVVAGFNLSSGTINIPNTIVPENITGATNILNWKQQVRQSARVLLGGYRPAEALPPRIAGALGLEIGRLQQFLALSGANLADPLIGIELWSDPPLPNPVGLTGLFSNLVKLKLLLRAPAFDAATLDFINLHKDIFGLQSGISMESVRKVSVYVSLATGPDPAFTPPSTPPDAASVRYVLATGLQDTSLDLVKVAAALCTDRVRVAAVLPNVIPSLPAAGAVNCLSALQQLARCIELANYLGVDGQTFKLAISDPYADLRQAAGGFYAAFRTKYPDEKTFFDTIEAFDDQLRGRRRDALTDYLLTNPANRVGLDPKGWVFNSKDELSTYFLVDVQLEGCARTSRVVAATSSVQLYVHRVLMNLEQSRDGRLTVSPQSIPQDEWLWRQNYRVWEANRKVFLYPENYIEPELRDDKTPLFKELEDTLLQQEITEQNVIDAYAKYMAGFEEVAKLKIAGSFHDRGRNLDTLYLFGVTPGDPPTYYYRKVDNAYNAEIPFSSGREARIVWSPWRKIDVQIPVRNIAPVVFQKRLYVFWVQISTQPKNQIIDGSSRLIGYKHKITLKFTMLRLDGSWIAPQEIALNDLGVVDESYSTETTSEVHAATPVLDPDREYTLKGFQWDQVYPTITPNGLLYLYLRNFKQTGIDFYHRVNAKPPKDPTTPLGQSASCPNKVLCSQTDGTIRKLYYAVLGDLQWYDFAHRSIVIDERRLGTLSTSFEKPDNWDPSFALGLYTEAILTLSQDDEIAVINGSLKDAILDVSGDLLLLQGSVRPNTEYLLKRIGTTLGEELIRKLFTGGLDMLLDIENQKLIKEAPLPITILNHIQNAANEGKLDFTGSYGTYYREIFFQIPFLIANHLNSQQKFSSSQQWYNYIFNPTAPNDLTLLNPSNRVWQYLEFRNLDKQDPQTLREILTDDGAIEAYRKDPFGPHAIARLRISAYQKSIVMKYIDNLLDWGDALFAQFTMESVNEATMLYIMAADILGPRPADVGDCGEGKITPKTYAQIAPGMKKGQDFLIELESLEISQKNLFTGVKYTIDADRAIGVRYQAISVPMSPIPAMNIERIGGPVPGLDGQGINGHLPLVTETGDHGLAKPFEWKEVGASYWTGTGGTSLKGLRLGDEVSGFTNPLFDPPKGGDGFFPKLPTVPDKYGIDQLKDLGKKLEMHFDAFDHAGFDAHHKPDVGKIPYVPPSIITSSAVFCIPENKELQAYWDRVGDRLYKVRNCMDISGVRRQLELFSPEIDPRMLVRMKAEGLTLEDILNVTNDSMPPYRFTFMIEKARQFAGTVQSLGSQLLSAMEKRDGEVLNQLRTIHEQNLLKLRTQVQDWEIKSAEDTLEGLNRQKTALEYRRDYYSTLVQNGLSPWERTQQISNYASNANTAAAIALHGVVSILSLVPELGAPTAMKYGGMELHSSIEALAMAMRDSAQLAQLIASSAGMEATFQRREDEWNHQVKVIEHELNQLEKQITAAEFRKEIAERSLEIHQKTIEQAEEIFEFYQDRFTGLGLYTWLSKELRKLYREGFNAALAMARMAEKAYHFERVDVDAPVITSHWEPSEAGLLAADRLLLDLQSLERRFIETNYRDLEINQSFSLSQWNPAALIQLREKGSCDFDIPEIFFDLTYPGQYRRKIKAVRLTVPCVTGPYTNVGATLTLNSGQVRIEAKSDASFLQGLSPSRADSIAVSKAQYDSGVFEFSFRDERYNHFEGAGAISNWKLSLPHNFRLFDYQTISDVILHIDYTAEEDSLFREKVETNMAVIKVKILDYFTDKPFFRAFSLRHDFPGEFHRLMHSPKNTEISIKLSEKFFPIFHVDRTIKISSAKLALRTPGTQSVSDFEISINSSDQTDFTSDTQLGGLPSKSDLQTLFTAGMQTELKFIITQAGDLAPASPTPGDESAISSDKLLDMLIYMEYTILN